MDPEQTQTRTVGDHEAAWADSSTGSGPRPSTTTATNGTGPSRASTADFGPQDVFAGDAKAFEGLIAAGVGLAGTLIDDRLSPHTHVWMPTEEEAASIAEPLARIAARHTPDVGGEASDIMDGLEAAVHGFKYVARARTDAKRAEAWEQQGDQNQP